MKKIGKVLSIVFALAMGSMATFSLTGCDGFSMGNNSVGVMDSIPGFDWGGGQSGSQNGGQSGSGNQSGSQNGSQSGNNQGNNQGGNQNNGGSTADKEAALRTEYAALFGSISKTLIAKGGYTETGDKIDGIQTREEYATYGAIIKIVADYYSRANSVISDKPLTAPATFMAYGQQMFFMVTLLPQINKEANTIDLYCFINMNGTTDVLQNNLNIEYTRITIGYDFTGNQGITSFRFIDFTYNNGNGGYSERGFDRDGNEYENHGGVMDSVEQAYYNAFLEAKEEQIILSNDNVNAEFQAYFDFANKIAQGEKEEEEDALRTQYAERLRWLFKESLARAGYTETGDEIDGAETDVGLASWTGMVLILAEYYSNDDCVISEQPITSTATVSLYGQQNTINVTMKAKFDESASAVRIEFFLVTPMIDMDDVVTYEYDCVEIGYDDSSITYFRALQKVSYGGGEWYYTLYGFDANGNVYEWSEEAIQSNAEKYYDGFMNAKEQEIVLTEDNFDAEFQLYANFILNLMQ